MSFPLPRKGVGLATGAVIVLGILGWIMPVLMMIAWARSGQNPIQLLREGGAFLYFDVLLLAAGPPLVAIGGAMMVRGRKFPPVLLMATAALPFAIAVFSSWRGMSLVTGAISGESVDPSQKARIMAEGLAEAMAGDVFGGLVAGGIAIAVAAACAAAIATVAGPTPKTPVPVIVSGALWFVASFVVAGLRLMRVEPGARAFSTILVVIALVPFAIAAGRQANALTQWNDKAEAQRIGGGLVVALVAAVFAALAIQRAFEASVFSPALEAISGESVDASQRMHLLAGGVYGIRLAPAAYAVHAVFGTLTFGLALGPLFGKGPDGTSRSPITGGAIGAVAIGLVLVLLTFGLAYKRTSSIETLDKASGIPAGVTLAELSSEVAGDHLLHLSDERVTVKKGDPSSGAPARCSGTSTAYVYADKDATMGALRTTLLAGHYCSALVLLRTRQAIPAEALGALGVYSKLLATSDGIPFELAAEAPKKSHYQVAIDSVSATQLEVDGKPLAFPIPRDQGPTAHGSELDQVVYTFHSTDTIDHAVQVISASEVELYYPMTQNHTKRYVTLFF